MFFLGYLNCAFFTSFAIFQFLFYPFAYIFWYVCLHPLKFINSNLRSRLLCYLYTGYFEILGAWNDFGGNKIYQCGDDISEIPEEDLKLFIINHQLLIDNSVLSRYLTANKFTVSKIMWMMDYLFNFFPFGKVCDLHGNLLVVQSSDVKLLSILCGKSRVMRLKDKQELDLSRRIVQNINEDNFNSVAFFPEGGLLYKRIFSSNEFAKKKGIKATKFVSLPKVNGFKNIVNSLRLTKKFQGSNLWIVDLTIAYPDNFGVKNLFFDNKKFSTVIDCRVFNYDKIFDEADDPETLNKSLCDWLMKRFYQKDEMLKNFYEKGHFQSELNCTPVNGLNFLNLFLINIVMLTTLFVVVPTFFVLLVHFLNSLSSI